MFTNNTTVQINMRATILSYRPAALVALFGLLAPVALAAAVDTIVPTPGGLRPKANVHAIQAGGHISHKREASGWIAWTGWLDTGFSPVSTFVSTWTVPPVPATFNGQLLYLFNSLFSYDANAIIQPVLQCFSFPVRGVSGWGRAALAVASWYVTGDSGFFSTLVNDNPGQVLNGTMTLFAQHGSTYGYSREFIGGIPGTSFTLETYGVTRKSDYPTGSTTFANTDVKLANGAAPSLAEWNITSDAADEHVAQVNVNGATNGKVTIVY
ncbi:hypothetical protein B0H19DRAFT_1264864 [Mycena capillaripes]|nr:hypothetical protein B0H19DRAFT_1264864 [Mycena capillaripes]